MEFLKSNLWEIKKSSALKYFGAVLALCHILTYLNWHWADDLPLKFYTQSNPMCWTFFDSCQHLRFFSLPVMEGLFTSYLVLAGLALFVFLTTQFVGLGWFFLLLTVILKCLFYFQDFRLSSNEHYLLLILNLCFLFIPNKQKLLRYLIVSFYIGTGLLKLYPQWMTGQWFEDRLQVPIKLGEWLAAIGYLIETIAPVALLIRDLRYFLISLLTLFTYHAFLWYTDGFFVPVIMMANLTLFLALLLEERRRETEFIYQSFIRPEPSKVWIYLGLGLFWAVQSLAILPIANPTMHQFGELVSLNPSTATEECKVSTFLIYENKVEEYSDPKDANDEFKCNAYVRYLDLKSLCEEKRSTPGFKTIAAYMKVRGLKEPKFHDVFQVEDFCDKQITFKTVGAN